MFRRLFQIKSSAFWAGTEYLVYPLVMFLSTPLLLHRLGKENFGLWMMVSAITASWGIGNFGMSIMLMRYVALHRGQENLPGTVAVIRYALGRSLIGGGTASLCLLLGAPWLSVHAFTGMTDTAGVQLALSVAAFLFLLAQIEFTFKSALKGHGEFGEVARYEVMGRSILIAIVVAIAFWQPRLILIYCALMAYAVVTVCVMGRKMARHTTGKACFPSWQPLRGGQGHFAFWAWLQSLGAVMFQQFDRLLIGALLGPVALAVYSICLQVAQQVHALPAAMFSYLLPRMSHLPTGAEDTARKNKFSRQVLMAGVGSSLLLGGGLTLLAKPLLVLWMGPEFANAHSNLLRVLVLGYTMLSLNVVPHFLLLALGRSRFVSVLNLIGGALGLIICFLALSPWGLLGAAYSKLVLGATLSVAYFFFFRRASKHVE